MIKFIIINALIFCTGYFFGAAFESGPELKYPALAVTASILILILAGTLVGMKLI